MPKIVVSFTSKKKKKRILAYGEILEEEGWERVKIPFGLQKSGPKS